LYQKAKQRLAEQGLKQVHCFYTDGQKGCPEYAPYEGIIVTCVADSKPPHALLEQLSNGGCLVIPIQEPQGQVLYLIQRERDAFQYTSITGVRFVPLLPGLD